MGYRLPCRGQLLRQFVVIAEQARMELAEVRSVIDKKFAQNLEMGNGSEGYWFDWLLARILVREATGSIEGGGGN